MIILPDIFQRFDPYKGASFEPYAERRLNGAMLDEVWRSDIFSHTYRDHDRQIKEAKHKLEQKLGRKPRDSEVAQELGKDLHKYQKLDGVVSGISFSSYEDLSDGGYFEYTLADNSQNPEFIFSEHWRDVASWNVRRASISQAECKCLQHFRNRT